MTSKQRILVVDDAPTNIKIMNDLLKGDYQISFATSGAEAVRLANSEHRPDLILLDVMMPEMDGYDVCRRLKSAEKTSNIPVLFVTAKGEVDDERMGLELGAVDYITKPISPAILKERVRTHMSLHMHREHLEELVAQRTRQLREGYLDTVQRLTLASEYKDEDTGAHIKRVSYYTREIAEQLGMDNDFCEAIFYASPMHDVGKVAIPDAILLKKGPLTVPEWEVIKNHTEIGATILDGSESPLLQMATEIARGHHERWDGTGYPHQRQGEAIPLPARIMNLADQYDALRSVRPYKPALSHAETIRILTKGDGRTMPAHFDPDVLGSFVVISDLFAEIFHLHGDDLASRKMCKPEP